MTVTDPDTPDPLNDPRTTQADPGAYAQGADLASTEDDAAAFWNLGIPGFSVGGVQDSNVEENPYLAAIAAAIRSTPVLHYTGGGTGFELASNVPAAGMTADCSLP